MLCIWLSKNTKHTCSKTQKIQAVWVFGNKEYIIKITSWQDNCECAIRDRYLESLLHRLGSTTIPDRRKFQQHRGHCTNFRFRKNSKPHNGKQKFDPFCSNCSEASELSCSLSRMVSNNWHLLGSTSSAWSKKLVYHCRQNILSWTGFLKFNWF